MYIYKLILFIFNNNLYVINYLPHLCSQREYLYSMRANDSTSNLLPDL